MQRVDPQKDFLNTEQLEKLLYLTIEESINIDAHVAKAFNYPYKYSFFLC